MRVYVPVERDHLIALRDGGSVEVEPYLSASTDEEDELAALETAAEDAPAVVVAEVDDPDGPVTLVDVEALHPSDGLAWFATQEIQAVIDLLG